MLQILISTHTFFTLYQFQQPGFLETAVHAICKDSTFLMSFRQMMISQTNIQSNSMKVDLPDRPKIDFVSEFKIIDLTLQTIQNTDSVLSENLFFLS